MQTVAETPSSLILAPQPPPSGPKLPMKNSEVRSLMPWNEDARRSAWWPAITRSGMAGGRRLKERAPRVIGHFLHPRLRPRRPAPLNPPRGTLVFRLLDRPAVLG